MNFVQKLLGGLVLLVFAVIGEIVLLVTHPVVGLLVLGGMLLLTLVVIAFFLIARKTTRYIHKTVTDALSPVKEGQQTTALAKLFHLWVDRPEEALVTIGSIGLFHWWWSGRSERKLKREIAILERDVLSLGKRAVLQAKLSALQSKKKSLKKGKLPVTSDTADAPTPTRTASLDSIARRQFRRSRFYLLFLVVCVVLVMLQLSGHLSYSISL